jgi:hypothetical protein
MCFDGVTGIWNERAPVPLRGNRVRSGARAVAVDSRPRANAMGGL